MEYFWTRAQNPDPSEAAMEACQTNSSADGELTLPLPFSSRACRRKPPHLSPPQTLSPPRPMSLPCYLLRPNVGLLIEALQVTHSEGTRPSPGRREWGACHRQREATPAEANKTHTPLWQEGLGSCPAGVCKGPTPPASQGISQMHKQLILALISWVLTMY